MNKIKCTAIVLAAGQGKRMNSKVQKQYLKIHGYPVLYYSLHIIEESPIIEQIILVTGEEDICYCQEEIVEKYGFQKVKAVIPGGAERQDSVWAALQTLMKMDEKWDNQYVFIHDAARPMLSEEILQRCYADVQVHRACITAVPVKDTIKKANLKKEVENTPDRSRLWQVQTPQVFDTSLIVEAYRKVIEDEDTITDDAMAVERKMGYKVYLTEGSYENIKITTSSDLKIAELFLEKSLT